MKESIRNAAPEATRSHTYIALNPELDVHPLYTKKSFTIPDYLRISFTRYRLSSHMLRVEIGRIILVAGVELQETNVCVRAEPAYKTSPTFSCVPL